PGVAGFLPVGEGGRREGGVGEGADGDGDIARKALAIPVDGGAAHGVDVVGEHDAAFGLARPRGGLAGEGDLLAAEARLVAEDGAGAALALQTVAHGDAHRLAGDGEVELPAAAGGAAGGHGLAPRTVDAAAV